MSDITEEEIRQYIEWQQQQINPLYHVTNAELWAKQTPHADPYTASNMRYLATETIKRHRRQVEAAEKAGYPAPVAPWAPVSEGDAGG